MYYNLILGPSGAHGRPGDRGEPGRPGMNLFITVLDVFINLFNVN